MIISQQQPPQFQPIVITIETLIELEALLVAVGNISYDDVAENSLTPSEHYDAIEGIYRRLKDL
jgi:hypothetical protein